MDIHYISLQAERGDLKSIIDFFNHQKLLTIKI